LENRTTTEPVEGATSEETGAGTAPAAKRHFVSLLTGVALLVALYFLFFRNKGIVEGLESLLYAVLVIVGIGLLIFIHELGHFLAAKLCDTKVEVFSVGFGPPIPGCHFKYGETLYKLAIIPIGGYVKLPGENPGDVDAEEVKKDPRLLPNKTVGQRLLIFSAGVIMNVLLGIVFFVIVYLNGKEERSALMGTVDPGSPAARAGIVAGSRLIEVDGKRNPTYEDLFFATALAKPNVTEIHLRWITPWGEEREGILIPRKLPGDQKPMIGVSYGYTLELPKGKTTDETTKRKRPLKSKDFGAPGSPVAEAGFMPGDVITGFRPVSAGGTAKPAEWTPISSMYDRILAEHRFRKEVVEYQVRRGDDTTSLRVGTQLIRSPGVHMTMGPIVSVGNPKYTAATAQQLKEGDVIAAIDGNDAFDPMRFPDLFMDAVEASDKVQLKVRRGGEDLVIAIDSKQLPKRALWGEEKPMGGGRLVGIPALGIAYHVDPIIATAPASLQSLVGGKLVKVSVADDEGIFVDHKLADDEQHWPSIFWRLQYQTKPVKFTVEKNGQLLIEEVKLDAVPGWYSPERGYELYKGESQTVVADGVWDAVRLGTIDTGRFIIRIYLNLHSLITGRLSVKYLSGPFKMFEHTYTMAEAGFIPLILFLAIISINLAVVNFLPIPVLDGGHVMFLLIEKIRGKPASERVFMIANAIGLTMVLALMLFVVVLDLSSYQWVKRLLGL
jgi:regulator of sigma E protease